MQQIELNVIESFRQAKSDIIRVQNVLAQVSQKQRELVETIDSLKINEARLNEKVRVLNDRLATQKIHERKAAPVVRKVVKFITKPAKRMKSIFVASKNGNKVHDVHCPFGKNIKPKMKIVFKTKNKAFNKGYKACDCLKRV